MMISFAALLCKIYSHKTQLRSVVRSFGRSGRVNNLLTCITQQNLSLLFMFLPYTIESVFLPLPAPSVFETIGQTLLKDIGRTYIKGHTQSLGEF